MINKNIDSLQKAKNYAFLLLKFRLRSEKEIRLRLEKKKFDPKTINETAAFLKDKDFINDNYFAHLWLESRLKRPLGLRRIKEELRQKGIAKEIIDSQIDAIKKDYSEEDIVTRVAQERLKRLSNIEPELAKRRLYAYLLRRGFSPETVIDIIRQLCKQTS